MLRGAAKTLLGNSSLLSPSYRVANMATFTLAELNPNVKRMEYAVRGPIVTRAVELEKELHDGAKKPFESVIKANIGDAHAMGQQPITFIRQVLACCAYPALIDSKDAPFPDDVRQRARELLAACGGKSVGAYTMSVGIEYVRKHAAEYITKRDGGIAADPDSIVLSGGASESIRNLMKLMVNHDQPSPAGVMIPIPQYPLYSATIAEYGLHQVNYYLDEDNGWALSIDELQRALDEAKPHCRPKALCVINPGNPTGQVLSRENIEAIIRFANANKLFLFADEVYQDNVYAPGSSFHSFKKVLMSLGGSIAQTQELASFMSVSKGYMGECGQRGGYAELVNVDPDVVAQFKKSISAKLCSTVMGQIVMDCVVRPPREGEASYKLFSEEKQKILSSLAERASAVEQTFNAIDGVHCNAVQGAMYAFPRFELPQAAVAAAEKEGVAPDFFYARALLESTGICIVPGSGFGQRPGTYHFRTTILPQPELMKDMLGRFRAFHEKFVAEYK